MVIQKPEHCPKEDKSWTESKGEKRRGNQRDGRTDTDMWFVAVSPISGPKPYKSMSSGLPFMCQSPKRAKYHLRHGLPNLFAPSSSAQQNLTSLYIHQNQVSSPRVYAYVNVRLCLCLCALRLCVHICTQDVQKVTPKFFTLTFLYSRRSQTLLYCVTAYVDVLCACVRSLTKGTEYL